MNLFPTSILDTRKSRTAWSADIFWSHVIPGYWAYWGFKNNNEDMVWAAAILVMSQGFVV